MSFFDLWRKLKSREPEALSIFDADEPVGQPTDLVLPRKPSKKTPRPQPLSHPSPR